MPDLLSIKNSLRAELTVLEQARLNLLRGANSSKKKPIGVLLLLFAASFLLLFFIDLSTLPLLYAIPVATTVLLLPLPIYAYIRSYLKSAKMPYDELSIFEHQVSAAAFQPTFQLWNKAAIYTPQKMVPKAALEQTFLKRALQAKNSTYQGKNYCEGQLPDGRAFYFSEIALHEWKTYRRGGSKKQEKIKSFEGLFFVLEQSSPFEGFTGRLSLYPKTDKIDPQLMAVSTEKNDLPKGSTELLDDDFLKQLTHAPTTTEAVVRFHQLYYVDQHGQARLRQQLSPEFCQGVLQLNEPLEQGIHLTFNKGNAYLYVAHPADYWPLNLHQPLPQSSTINGLAQQFQHIFFLVDTLAALTKKNASK